MITFAIAASCFAICNSSFTPQSPDFDIIVPMATFLIWRRYGANAMGCGGLIVQQVHALRS